MGALFFILIVLWISTIDFYQLSTADFATSRNCSQPLEGCVRCSLSGDLCVKCRQVIVEGTRECRAACPAGRREEWPSSAHLHGEYMGRVCIHNSLFSGLGLNGHHAALLVGLLSGILLSVVLLFGALLYVRRRKLAAMSTVDDSSESTLTVSPLNPNERLEFLQSISELRPDASIFLAMLNDTRRQFRNVTENPANNRPDQLQPYRSVIRDLGLILFLLHKPEEKLHPPTDWRRLLAWGARVLRRYRKTQASEQVTELVSFLPNDGETFNTLSTVASSTLDRMDNNNFCNDFNRFSFGAEFDAIWGGNWNREPTVLSDWSASRDFIYDDNFIRLGFRPQDEITTEL